jgi:pimeloyl-ACP methyl ester carboxylesterase
MSVVVLLGGFGMPAVSLRRLRATLVDAGHDVRIAPLGRNIDCGERTVRRLLAETERTVAERGATVDLVGHSRGGQLALVAAVRRPDLVRRLVTIATPWSVGPPDRPGVAAVARGLRALRGRGVDLVPSIDCGDGECCAGYREDLGRKPAVPWTALWSSADRVAGDDSRAPAAADSAVDLGTGHLGAVLDRDALARVATVLGDC